MKIRIFLLLIASGLLVYQPVTGQGRILLLNGKEKRFTSAEIKGDLIVYQPEGLTKTRRIDKYDVFSIIRDNAGEEVIYNPDTVAGDDPTVTEAREYIMGEKYAAIVYRKPWNFISGIAVGGAGSLLNFYGLAVPVIYPAILGRFTPKIKGPVTHSYNESTGSFTPVHYPDATSNIIVTEAFSAGYGKKARNMKIKNSMIGGGLGFAVGITALVLILGQD